MGRPAPPGGGPRVRLKAADRAKRAAELMVAGWTSPEIAKELGYADHSGVLRAIERHRKAWPAPAIEALRDMQLARITKAYRAIERDLESDDPRVRIEAAKAIATLSEKQARIAGIVKLAPPVVVNQSGALDVSALPAEQLWQIREWIIAAGKAKEGPKHE